MGNKDAFNPPASEASRKVEFLYLILPKKEALSKQFAHLEAELFLEWYFAHPGQFPWGFSNVHYEAS